MTLCGSQRVGSFNKIVHDSAVRTLQELGATVNVIDLDALNLPLYNPNDEATSFPEAAKALKSQLVDCGTLFRIVPLAKKKVFLL